MSYILDALKRADAERERGAVPGLHAQPAAMALPDEGSASPLPPWAWGVGGLVVAVAGMLAWSWWSGHETPPAHRASEAWPSPQGRVQEPGAALGGLAPTATDQREAVAPRDPAPSGQARPARPAREPANAPNPQTTVKPVTAAPAPAPAPPAAASTTPASPKAPTAEAPAAASPRVYALHELPDHVRRGLPQLVIGGAMYSDNPGSRMLVINSQLFHEGDKLGPDLTLEEIKLKSAVLRYRNWRYGVTY